MCSQYEYTTTDLKVGAKVLIHNKDETPDISQEGINIPAGFQANIHFSKTSVRPIVLYS